MKSASADGGPDVVLGLAGVTSLNGYKNPVRQMSLSPFYG